jgi:16S rRNA (adenine1518-N6/adenine1519-N6)-dimethyltransferase
MVSDASRRPASAAEASPRPDPEPQGEPGPRQASLRRLRRFGIRPNRELGQNFLIDDNVLGVIGRAAELDPADVVLEVGGGLGVLSEYLAARVAYLHVVEVDPALVPALEEALGPFPNSALHVADAARLDFRSLDPAPGKVVANLPYGVAATVILKSISDLPEARLWVAMVQREVADRLAAPPGSRTYGAPSALAQLSCHVTVHRRISSNVFFPVPRVESALVVLRRHSPPPAPALGALVSGAFAHRRKALPRSLALTAGAPPGTREAARAALAAMGQPEDARAESLSPEEFRALAGRLGEELLAAIARDRASPAAR